MGRFPVGLDLRVRLPELKPEISGLTCDCMRLFCMLGHVRASQPEEAQNMLYCQIQAAPSSARGPALRKG